MKIIEVYHEIPGFCWLVVVIVVVELLVCL